MTESAGWIYLFAYMGAIGLILLGLFAIVMYRNVIRMILGLILLESGINLFLIAVGFRADSVAPILEAGQTALTQSAVTQFRKP